MNDYNAIRQQILDKHEKIQNIHNVLMYAIPIVIIAIVIAITIGVVSEYKQKRKEIEVKDLERQILNLKYQVMAAQLKADSGADPDNLEELEKIVEQIKKNSSK